jgi:Ca-activated chloride channel family protein
MAIALAGPRLPQANNETPTADKNIMFVVDVSRSMLAQDISPSRLQRAVLEMVEFLHISRSRNNVSRIGVIVYAARPHVLVPLTDDMEALKFYLEKLDTLVLPTRGSDPAAAINKANALLADQQQDALPSLIVWLTDGDFENNKIALINNKRPLYILGLGTEDGDAIPLGQDKWLMHKGKTVRTTLNSALLQKLANDSGGRYSPVKENESDWQYLYQGIDAALPRAATDTNQQQWQELFVWALFPALMIFFLLLALPQGSMASILLLVLAIGLSTPQQSYAADLDRHSESAMQAGIHAYRTGDFSQAIRHFSQAVFEANTDMARARALHNLGNSYFQQADYMTAAQVFRDALRYRGQHQATQQNLALAEAVQAALEQRLALRQQSSSEGETEVDGSRMETVGNDLNWDQDSTKTSGESVNKSAPGLPSMPLQPATLRRLVSKGLQRLGQQGVKSFAEESRRKQSLAEAQIAMQEMDDNPAIFWKRLFEIEEGFPGSLEKPREIPGVEPW